MQHARTASSNEINKNASCKVNAAINFCRKLITERGNLITDKIQYRVSKFKFKKVSLIVAISLESQSAARQLRTFTLN